MLERVTSVFKNRRRKSRQLTLSKPVDEANGFSHGNSSSSAPQAIAAPAAPAAPADSSVTPAEIVDGPAPERSTDPVPAQTQPKTSAPAAESTYKAAATPAVGHVTIPDITNKKTDGEAQSRYPEPPNHGDSRVDVDAMMSSFAGLISHSMRVSHIIFATV